MEHAITGLVRFSDVDCILNHLIANYVRQNFPHASGLCE
jgi:hypothetical protein